MKKTLLSIALLSFSASLTLGLCELFLRSLEPNDYLIWTPGKKEILKPLPEIMPGITSAAQFEATTLGLRGDELGNDIDLRILAIGGSTTECLFLDLPKTWPYLVQTKLNSYDKQRIWVGNAGKSGNTSRHHVLQAKHLLDEIPDVDAVLLMSGLNDFLLRLARDKQYNPKALQDSEERNKLLSEAFEVHPKIPTSDNSEWYKNTAIFRRINMLDAPTANKPGAIVHDSAGESYVVWRKHRASASRIIEELPNLDAALAEFQQNLENTIDEIRRHGAQPVLITQAYIWREDLPEELKRLLWTGGKGSYQIEPGGEYYSISALKQGLTLYNNVTMRSCRDKEALCIDISTKIPQDSTAFYDDVHFNENGSLLVANLVAMELKKLLLEN